ncbi:sugar transferase [Cryobacterium suzukii]|uniref:Sugar transferase n=1 Tax=Cryobacterium suzukii TaxID=1259198 RepID=A0A4R9AK28_9MICO|nr:sugar transferase [Cryobacterium suzukii]TFD63142.1 sugar transferase [Cryobacterium suzukii]
MYRPVKRILDLLGAAVLIVITAPITFLLALALAIAHRGSPFFVQERIGFREQNFRIVKFKTMSDIPNDGFEPLPDAERLTALGRIVREASLDEIPQLINVLRGEMSFVGPRPLLVRYLPCYRGEERIRHTVRPGITGLAQVRGRNDLGWDSRLAFDVQYVRQLSASLDARILLATVKSVLTASGVRVDAHSGELRDLDVERGR